jgi:hypothetical protein
VVLMHADETCTDCRIELVGPCPECEGDGNFDGWDYATPDEQRTPENIETIDCDRCDATGTVTLGHAYAVGQPLPISDYQECRSAGARHDHLCVYLNAGPEHASVTRIHASLGVSDNEDITAALAHYGPPETLVGRWALQLRVTP